MRVRVRDIDFGENIDHTEVDASDQDLFAGVGGAWNINEGYSLRFEFQRYFDVGEEDTGEADFDMFAFSLLLR